MTYNSIGQLHPGATLILIPIVLLFIFHFKFWRSRWRKYLPAPYPTPNDRILYFSPWNYPKNVFREGEKCKISTKSESPLSKTSGRETKKGCIHVLQFHLTFFLFTGYQTELLSLAPARKKNKFVFVWGQHEDCL